MKTVSVTASRNYEVKIGRGLLDRAGEALRSLTRTDNIAIVTDSNVAPLYLDRVQESLRAAGYRVQSFVFPAGEPSKNGETYLKLLGFLADHHLTRTDTVAALGGGFLRGRENHHRSNRGQELGRGLLPAHGGAVRPGHPGHPAGGNFPGGLRRGH